MNTDRFIKLLKNRLTALVIGSLIGILIFLAYFFFMFNFKYSSELKVLVKNIIKQNVVASYGGGRTVSSESGFSNPLFNIVQILYSKRTSNKVYDGIKDKYSEDLKKLNVTSKEKWHDVYLSSLSAKIKPSTDIIDIKFEWINSKNTNEIFDIILKQFKAENLEIRKTVEINKKIHLKQQLDNIAEQLDNTRSRIKNYKVNKNAINVQIELDEITKARVELEKTKETLKSKISYNNAKMKELANQLSMQDAKAALKATSIGGDPYIISLNEKLADSKQKLANLNANFTDKYPVTIALKDEIDKIEQIINVRKHETLGKDNNLSRGLYDRPSQEIVIDLARAQADNVSMQKEFLELKNSINKFKMLEQQLPEKQRGLKLIEKEEEALATAYNKIKQKYLEAVIKEKEIVDNLIPLGTPRSPSSNKMALIFKFVGFLGLGVLGGLTYIYLKDDIEDKFFDVNDIEKTTGKDSLGVIPWLSFDKEFFKVSNLDSLPIFSNSIENITINLIDKIKQKKTKAITLISNNYTNNQSYITHRIASSLALFGRTVILVDITKNTSDIVLNELKSDYKKITIDLTEIIDNINQALKEDSNISNIKKLINKMLISETKTSSKFFYHIGIKNEGKSLNEYISTEGYSLLIETLKEQFEFVLINSPSMPLFKSEMKFILNSSDAVGIIASKNTTRSELKELTDKLDKFNIDTLGIISRDINSEVETYYSNYVDKTSIN